MRSPVPSAGFSTWTARWRRCPALGPLIAGDRVSARTRAAHLARVAPHAMPEALAGQAAALTALAQAVCPGHADTVPDLPARVGAALVSGAATAGALPTCRATQMPGRRASRRWTRWRATRPSPTCRTPTATPCCAAWPTGTPTPPVCPRAPCRAGSRTCARHLVRAWSPIPPRWPASATTALRTGRRPRPRAICARPPTGPKAGSPWRRISRDPVRTRS